MVKVGDVVIYNTTLREREQMSNGTINGYSNQQERLPAIVTVVWSGELINARVIADGSSAFDLWKTSIGKRPESADVISEGTWQPIV